MDMSMNKWINEHVVMQITKDQFLWHKDNKKDSLQGRAKTAWDNKKDFLQGRASCKEDSCQCARMHTAKKMIVALMGRLLLSLQVQLHQPTL
jgi:hypothetical protein